MSKINLLIIKTRDVKGNNGVLNLGTINKKEEKYLLKCYVKESEDGILIIESQHDTYDKAILELNRVVDEYPNSEHDVTIIIDDN